jgi:hypothetical protein
MGKILLNLDFGEPLALLKKFPYFDNMVELYVLLVVRLHLVVHDMIDYIFLKEDMIDLCRGQLLNHLRGVQ